MKTVEEILSDKRIYPDKVIKGEGGVKGYMRVNGEDMTFVASWGGGWDHVSVAPLKRSVIPSWEIMCKVKEIFFYDTEAVIQIHPPESEYVNNMSNCLHLWRCRYKEMVLPPSCFVGIKPGQTTEELMKEIKEAYELAGEKYDG